MFAVLTLLTVVTISIIITRIATVALIQTGLARESARFQARSALSGVGFTTNEAERVVGHPVRRRIILALMLIGNVGFVGAVSSLLLTFLGDSEHSLALKAGALVSGLVALWLLSTSHWVDRRLSYITDWALSRWTDLDARDYASLMHLVGDYRLAELEVEDDDWLAERTLADLALRDEGVVVLGIKRRDGSYLGAPDGDSFVGPADILIVYGRAQGLAEIDDRRRGYRGDVEHATAVAKQAEVEAQERQHDKEVVESEMATEGQSR